MHRWQLCEDVELLAVEGAMLVARLAEPPPDSSSGHGQGEVARLAEPRRWPASHFSRASLSDSDVKRLNGVALVACLPLGDAR